MGMKRNEYLMIGYKLDRPTISRITGEPVDWRDYRYENYIAGNKNKTPFSLIIEDDYVVFGFVLARTDENGEHSIAEMDMNYVSNIFNSVYREYILHFDFYIASSRADATPAPKLIMLQIYR
jgi:hypothetical protein